MAKAKSLLERAKEVRSMREGPPPPSDQEVELAIAWFKGEVANVQAGAALGKSPSQANNTVYEMACILRAAVLHGKVRL